MININEETIKHEAYLILSKVHLEQDSFEEAEDLQFTIADHVADHEWMKDSYCTNLLASYYYSFVNSLEIYAEADNTDMWNGQVAFQVLEAAVYKQLRQSHYDSLKEIHNQAARKSFLKHCAVSC